MESAQKRFLDAKAFDAQIKNNTLRLAFVGMSNAGKSFRAQVLKNELGFLWYHVDEEVASALQLETVQDVARWLGFPGDIGYQGREERYLELEDIYTRQAAMGVGDGNLVFDTTGSVVHLDQGTLDVLKMNCLIVHLDIGDDSLTAMMEKFFCHPKPIAWCGFFSAKAGESREDALKRSYPRLLRERLRRYRQLAHINVPAEELYDASGHTTLMVIRKYLR